MPVYRVRLPLVLALSGLAIGCFWFSVPAGLQPAIAQPRAGANPFAEADRLFNESLQLWQTSQFQLATEKLQQALAIYRRPDLRAAFPQESRQGEGQVLTGLGAIADSLGRYNEALIYYQQALALNIEVSDRAGEADTLNNLGSTYQNLGDYAQALNYYQRALAIAQTLDDYANESTILSNIGSVHSRLDNYAPALDYYQQALAVNTAIGDRLGEAAILTNIGSVYGYQGEYETALDYHRRALVIHRSVGNRAGEAATLNNMGLVLRQLSHYSQALDYYQQALAIRTEIGQRAGEATTLNNMGITYYYLGNYGQALDYYQRALSIRTTIGDRAGEGTTLNSIGLGYDRLEEYDQALNYYQRALAIRTAIGDRAGEGTTLNNIGATYTNLGNYPEALTYYQHALTLRQAIGDRAQTGTTLNNMGLLYSRQGDYEQALNAYQQALAIRRAVGDRYGEGTTLYNLGYLLNEMEQPELAIVFLKQSVNQWESIRGEIRELSTEQQQLFVDSISDSYRALADLLLQADRVLEAQRVLDLLKVQELDEYLHDVQRNAQTESGVALLESEAQIRDRQQQITNQAIAIGEELAHLRQLSTRTPAQMQRLIELENQQAEIMAQFADFIDSHEIQTLVAQLSREARQHDLVNQLDDIRTLQDSLAALEDTTVLLYPLVLEDRLELVLVTPNGPPARYPVPVSRTELTQTVTAFRQALVSRTRRPEPVAQQLYQWLIQPIAADLEAINAKTILYAPDGVLRYAPLAALHDGQHWLVEGFQINQITAASLTTLTLAPTVQPNVLAGAFRTGAFQFQVGERNFAMSGLPFAGQEVDNLASVFPDTTKLFDDQFSPTATIPIMDDYSIVHFATHAEFVQGSPRDSFILFGNGDRLSLEDIKQWRGRFRNIDLIVLSACETGVGERLGDGQEILGFGYLMQQAGARAAIASLWSINDEGTQTLMTAFYTALSNGYSKAEALQRAQIALIRHDPTVLNAQQDSQPPSTAPRGTTAVFSQRDSQGSLSHPYYWAPFILIGNGL